MLMLLCVLVVETNNNESSWRKKERDNWKKREKEPTNFQLQQAKDMRACQKKKKAKNVTIHVRIIIR